MEDDGNRSGSFVDALWMPHQMPEAQMVFLQLTLEHTAMILPRAQKNLENKSRRKISEDA